MCNLLRERAGALFASLVSSNRTGGGLGETICVPGTGVLHHVILSDRVRAWCYVQTAIGNVDCVQARREVCEHIRMALVFLDSSAQFCYSLTLANALGHVRAVTGMQSKQVVYVVSKSQNAAQPRKD